MLSNDIRFSIIVPIYNVEQYIRKCLDSIINQSYENIEIILVDDGSPDLCPKICDEYSAKDERIKVIHKKNEGLIAARKSGVEIATGDYISFVDGDDWIEKDMYSKVNDSISAYNSDICITQFFYAYEDHNEFSNYDLNKEYYSKEDIELYLYPKMIYSGNYYSFGIYPNCWSKVFKSNLVKNNLFNSDNCIRIGEDASFVYSAIIDSQSISFVNLPLYNYRINPKSMTKSYDKELVKTFYLPYLCIKNKSELKNVDISEQLSMYLLYLSNFAVRNETIRYINEKNISKKRLEYILNNEYLIREIMSIDSKELPFHIILLIFIFRKNSYILLNLYIRFFKYFI